MISSIICVLAFLCCFLLTNVIPCVIAPILLCLVIPILLCLIGVGSIISLPCLWFTMYIVRIMVVVPVMCLSMLTFICCFMSIFLIP